MKVLGHRVLLEMVSEVKEEKRSEGGIILAKEEKVYEEDSEIGIVRQIGATAYKDLGEGEPWIKVGDRVMIARYAGKKVPGHKLLRVVNDEEVILDVNDLEV